MQSPQDSQLRMIDPLASAKSEKYLVALRGT